MFTTVSRRLSAWVVALALLLSLSTAFATPPELVLDDARPQTLAWPAVMVRGDAAHSLTPDEVRRCLLYTSFTHCLLVRAVR